MIEESREKGNLFLMLSSKSWAHAVGKEVVDKRQKKNLRLRARFSCLSFTRKVPRIGETGKQSGGGDL